MKTKQIIPRTGLRPEPQGDVVKAQTQAGEHISITDAGGLTFTKRGP